MKQAQHAAQEKADGESEREGRESERDREEEIEKVMQREQQTGEKHKKSRDTGKSTLLVFNIIKDSTIPGHFEGPSSETNFD